MLVSRTGLSPVMVGRDAELGQLLRLLAAPNGSTPGGTAHAGGHAGGTVALIGGEPGIGKTRLVSELIGAVPAGTKVLVGQADPGVLGHPYHLLGDLVDGDVGLLPADGSPQERMRAGLELLRSVAATAAGVVLVVDDLHWADPESMAVIERLIENPPSRLLVVGTYRPEELTRRHPTAEMVQRLERRHTVVHLRLERLGQGDVAGFLAAVFGRPTSHRVAGKLHQRTGGNPFFLEELLKAAGGDDPEEICVQPLPWTLAEALRSQLDDLAPEQRRVVEAAAVLGARVSFDLLAAVTGTAESDLIVVLRDLVGRGLLVESEEDEFGFRHALTREVIAGEMLGRERRRLHEAALEILGAMRNPDLAAVATHAAGAGRYADMVAAARLGSAARLTSGSTYAALKLAELGLEEEPDDVELLATAAQAAWLAGYYEDAERHADQWLRSAPDAVTRSAALRLLVRLAWETLDLKAMDARTSDVRAVVDELPDGEERARAYAALAQSYMLQNSYPEAIAWADRAAEAASRLDLPEVALNAVVEKGTSLLNVAETRAEGAAMLTDVADRAERAGAYVAATRALHNLFWEMPAQSPKLADLLERMRADSERAGLGGNFAGSYHEGRAWLATLAGDQDAAIAALEAVGRPDHDWAGAARSLKCADTLASLYLERGDLDLAEATLRAEVPTEVPYGPVFEALAAQLACWRGDLTRARARLGEFADAMRDLEVVPADMLHDVVTAALAVGISAAELADMVLLEDGRVRPTGYKPHHEHDAQDHPIRLSVAAHLAEAIGRPEEALAAYLSAALAEPMDAHDVPGHRRASDRVGAARCLLALGRPDEARPHVRAAAELLARWPGWRRAQLDPLMRRLGVSLEEAASTPSTSDRGAGSDTALTPREREVAALLAEGLTNAELARRLVISRKTAAVHVSNILAKLGMTSRAQIAAWVSREGAGAGG